MIRKEKGVTLIELLIALVVGSFLTTGLYRLFITEQKVHTVQEQVADVQQNVRVAMDRMTREIRMAGYRREILNATGNVRGFTKVITPINNANHVGENDDQVTIIIGDRTITYQLQWETADPTMPVLVRSENGLSEVLADNVENLQFQYVLKDGTVTDLPANPDYVRMVRVQVSARTGQSDPGLSGDGYRRRRLSSFVEVRNFGL